MLFIELVSVLVVVQLLLFWMVSSFVESLFIVVVILLKLMWQWLVVGLWLKVFFCWKKLKCIMLVLVCVLLVLKCIECRMLVRKVMQLFISLVLFSLFLLVSLVIMYSLSMLVLFFLKLEVWFFSVLCMVFLLFRVFLIFKLCVILWNMVFWKNVLKVRFFCWFLVISCLVIGSMMVLNFVCIMFFSCSWCVFFFNCICLLLGRLMVMVLVLMLVLLVQYMVKQVLRLVLEFGVLVLYFVFIGSLCCSLGKYLVKCVRCLFYVWFFISMQFLQLVLQLNS